LYLGKSGKEDGYCILGEYTGVFRIVNTNGEDYVVKQAGDCPQLSDAKVTENNDNSKIRNTLTKSYSVEFSNLDKTGLP